MKNINAVFKLLFAAGCCVLASGCTCVSFNPAGGEGNGLSLSGTKKYQIVNAETLKINPTDKTDQLSELKYNMLAKALSNMPGNDFGKLWSKDAPEIDRKRDYQKILTNDTDTFKISCRVIAPNIFDNSSGAIPVQVKSVIVILPGNISPWWMTGYLLTLSMSPMRESSLGTAIVAVLDGNGNTIGSKVIVFRRSYWISALLPTAAMCGGKYSISKVSPDNVSADEKSLLNQIAALAVTDILNINSGKAPAVSAEWINIRAAAVESIMAGNESAAVTLLKDSRRQSIGGKECQEWLDLID